MTMGASRAPGGHHVVEPFARPLPFPVAEPADPGRQALGRDTLAGHGQPAAQAGVVAEHVQDGVVGGGDVGRVAGKGRPAERAFALAEQRTDVGRDEARVIKGPLEPAQGGFGPQAVAVVEDFGAASISSTMAAQWATIDARASRTYSSGSAGAARRVGQGHPRRHVAEGVVRRGLVGHDVNPYIAPHDLGQELGPVADQPYRQRAGLVERACSASASASSRLWAKVSR